MVTFIIIYLTLFIVLGWLLIRNHKVRAFREKVNIMAYEYSVKHLYDITSSPTRLDGWELSYDKLPSYNKMLFSQKRLTLESYFDQETINELLS